MSLDTLQDLLVAQLKDIYSAEKQITVALPRLARTAASQALAETFEKHLAQTHGQISRLEEVFDYLGVSP
jgi:ferritin-like metal-binding protein YciE